MTPTTFILLVNPVVSVIFAGALLLLWKHQPQLRFVGLLSLSFGLKVAGFLAQFVGHPDLFITSRLASNFLFLAAASTLCLGLISRHPVRPPYGLLMAISGLAFALIAWFLVVQPSFVARVVAINAGLAASCFVTAWCLAPMTRTNGVEKLLVVLTVAYGAVALARPLIVLMPDAAPTLSTDSPYWIAVTASDLILSLLLVLAIFSGIALDVIDRLRDESERDPLSGLLNRRGFMDRANAFALRAHGANIPATVILADLDRFKAVNDTYGHDAGDRAIVAFANHLESSSGGYAIVGRLGGEEFVIFLPAGQAAAGRLFADGVRIAFATTPVPGIPAPIRITASFGVAELARGENLESAMRRADAALYAAKARGRDRTVVAAPLERAAGQPRLASPAA